MHVHLCEIFELFRHTCVCMHCEWHPVTFTRKALRNSKSWRKGVQNVDWNKALVVWQCYVCLLLDIKINLDILVPGCCVDTSLQHRMAKGGKTWVDQPPEPPSTWGGHTRQPLWEGPCQTTEKENLSVSRTSDTSVLWDTGPALCPLKEIWGAWDFAQPVCMCFLDLEKAFDHSALWVWGLWPIATSCTFPVQQFEELGPRCWNQSDSWWQLDSAMAALCHWSYSSFL